MKKKILALAACVCMSASLVACGGSESGEETSKTEGKITLGQYKGMEVNESTATVTDEELKDYIDYILDSNKTTTSVTEGTTKKGDSVKVTYTATKDGEKISALSSTSSTIVLDEGSFAIDGFVDYIIGKKVGETVEFDITIQEDFTTEEYQGMTVHYAVEIKSIEVTTVPELTDEWAKENYGYLGINNAAEFTAYYKDNLYLNTVYNDIIDKVLANQKVEEYDSEELASYTQQYRENFESQLSYYGIEIDAYLQAMNKTEESFTAEMEEQAKEFLLQKMFVLAVAEEEGLTVTDEEYSAKMLEYAKSMGLESQEELESYYDGHMDTEDYKYSILAEKVQRIMCENIKIVPDEEESTTQEEKAE